MPKSLRFFVPIVAFSMAFFFVVGCKPKNEKTINDYLEEDYGPLGKSADEILSHAHTEKAERVAGALVYRIEQKADTHGEGSLTKIELEMDAVAGLKAEVDNGGFEQYFFNSTGDEAEDALAGLKAMGANVAASLLERAVAVFPGGKPPPDRAKRQKIMGQIQAQSKPVWDACDEEFFKLKEDFDALSLEFALKNRTEIKLP